MWVSYWNCVWNTISCKWKRSSEVSRKWLWAVRVRKTALSESTFVHQPPEEQPSTWNTPSYMLTYSTSCQDREKSKACLKRAIQNYGSLCYISKIFLAILSHFSNSNFHMKILIFCSWTNLANSCLTCLQHTYNNVSMTIHSQMSLQKAFQGEGPPSYQWQNLDTC